MAKYCVKNVESNEYLYNDLGVFTKYVNKALLFPTFKRAQKEAKKYNKRMNEFYKLNEDSFSFFKGKNCDKYFWVEKNKRIT